MIWLLTAFWIWEVVMATFFSLAEHIGKLHADEVDAFLLHHADNIFFGIFAHTVKFPFHMKKGPVSLDSEALARLLKV